MEFSPDKLEDLIKVQNTIYKAALQLNDIVPQNKEDKQDYRLMALNLLDVWSWIDNKLDIEKVSESVEEINGRYICTACGHEWSATAGDNEVPEVCDKCEPQKDFCGLIKV